MPGILRNLGSVVWGFSHRYSAAVQGATASGLLETKAKAHFTEVAIVARREGVLGPPEVSSEPDQTQRR